MDNAKIFFPHLDGLRFLSFLIVFLSHSWVADTAAVADAAWYKSIKIGLFSDGDLGVIFFFVLSGFLITYLLLAEKQRMGKIHLGAFYIRRALRIWPLYYFSVFFGFVLFPLFKSALGQVPNETANPLLCATFLNNFDRMNHIPDSSVLSVLWSVAIEEQFYLAWPLLFLLVPSRFYAFIFVGVLGISTLFRAIYHPVLNVELHTLGVITDMAMGGLGAYLAFNYAQFRAFLEKMPRICLFIPYIAALFLFLYKDALFYNSLLITLKRLIISFFFIWIILEQNYARHSWFKMGNFKIISQLGKYTYGLYCLHTIAILISLTVLRKLGLHQHSYQLWLLELPLSMFLSIVISYISYTYFESWFLRLKTRFSYLK
jgi:peptidoglycan/LPS O-acetylase OafA/YrhL